VVYTVILALLLLNQLNPGRISITKRGNRFCSVYFYYYHLSHIRPVFMFWFRPFRCF